MAHYCLNALSYFITKWTTSNQSSSSTQNVHRIAGWQDSEVSGHDSVKKNSETLWSSSFLSLFLQSELLIPNEYMQCSQFDNYRQ
jgi:hypothetical protein